MACVNPDGTLTASASSILRALTSPATPDQVARATDLPLYRVRSGLREMVEAKMATEHEGLYERTDLGAAKSHA
jgi:hypothetical protein